MQSLDKIAGRLIESGDASACLDNLRCMYPNLNTLRTVVTRLKRLVLKRNIHDDSYADAIEAYRRHLMTLDDPKRRADLENFIRIPLERQVKLQKKIMLGDPTLCQPEDVAFYTSIRLTPSYVDMLRLTPEEHHQWKTNADESLRRKSQNVIRIERCDDLVTIARSILRQDCPPADDVIIALALVTGRRMVELLLTGDFQLDPHDKYGLFFSGQAKSGLRQLASMTSDYQSRYHIPVLASGTSILRSFQRIRKGLGNITEPKQVNTQWCKRLNHRVRQLIHPDVTFHDLRMLYGLVSFEVFKPHRYGINGWISRVLGQDGPYVSCHYTKIQISGCSRLCRRQRGDEDLDA